MDLTGIDVSHIATRTMLGAFQGDPRLKSTPHHALLVEAGHLGRKSSIGHYQYGEGGRHAERPSPDHKVSAAPATRAFLPEPGERLRTLLAAAGIAPVEDDGKVPIVAAPLGKTRPAPPSASASILGAWSRSTSAAR